VSADRRIFLQNQRIRLSAEELRDEIILPICGRCVEAGFFF
jgi:hypothetical protein